MPDKKGQSMSSYLFNLLKSNKHGKKFCVWTEEETEAFADRIETATKEQLEKDVKSRLESALPYKNTRHRLRFE